MRRIRTAWDELWDRFSASDPGLLRLSRASTVVAAILLTIFALGLLHTPVTLVVAGALAAMVASFAISDPSPRDQAITLALGLCVAVGVTAVGAELYRHRGASDVLFVALIFIAVYIRRFGPRGTGLGLMAFQLYFVSQFTRADPATLPQTCVALAIGFAAAAVARFALVRATPERTLDRLRRAFRARLAAVIEAMVELAEQSSGSPAAEAAARLLRRRTTRLHQCALLIQARLGSGLPDARAASLVERRVAEAEISAERLGRLLLRALSRTPPEEPNPADPALRTADLGFVGVHADFGGGVRGGNSGSGDNVEGGRNGARHRGRTDGASLTGFRISSATSALRGCLVGLWGRIGRSATLATLPKRPQTTHCVDQHREDAPAPCQARRLADSPARTRLVGQPAVHHSGRQPQNRTKHPLTPPAAAARLRLPAPVLLGLRPNAVPTDPAVARLTGELRLLRILVLRTVPGSRLAGFEAARDRLLGYRDGARIPQTDPAVRDVYLAAGELARAILGLRMVFGYETDPQDDSPHTARSREELETEELSFGAREAGPGERGEAAGLNRISTRLAFQVAAGSALAILGGELLSAQRWYWAVLTCWVVFINTSSTGDILIKGYRRLAGTVAGVLAGGALAGVLNGDPRIAFALAITCVFGMFFTAALSYALMSFFVTTMIGLLYTLLGIFSPGVLVLRIEETALGAACGFLAAMFVLPVRASRHTDQNMITVLNRLRETLSLSIEQLTGDTKADVLHAARDMDAALDSLHASMEPLTHPVNPLRVRRQRARYVVRLLDSCAYHVRSLAAIAEMVSHNPSVIVEPRIAEVGRRLDENAATLTEFLRDSKNRSASRGRPHGGGERGGPRDRGLRTEPGISDLLEKARPQKQGPVTRRVLRHLQRIDEALLALARPLGVPAADPAAHRADDSAARRISPQAR